MMGVNVMKSVVSKKSFILAIIVMLILLCVSTVGSYFYALSVSRGASIKQYLLIEDVKVGHSLEGKYKEQYVSEKTSLDEKNLIVDSTIIDSSVAAHDLYKNSPITPTNITKLSDLERKFEVAIPVTVEGSVANSIKPGDSVAVKLTYRDVLKEDAVVISRITVKDIKSSNGTAVTDDNVVTGFVIFDTTSSEQSDIKNALKEGTFYCAKYTDLGQKPLDKTYNGPTASTKTETDKAKESSTETKKTGN